MIRNEPSVRASRRRSILLVQVLVAAAMLGLVWLSLAQNVLGGNKGLGVPRQLGGLNLISSVSGPDAIAEVRRLHGTAIDVADAYVAEYVDAEERATVWVAQTNTPGMAEDLTRRMVEAIGDGGSAFSGVRRLAVAGHEVFRVDGPGGEHFFYSPDQGKPRVVWVSIQSIRAMPLVELAVATF